MLSEWAAALDLILANRGDAPTIQRGASESVIDLTWSSQEVAPSIQRWTVTHEKSLSLHRYILFDIDPRAR